MSIEGKHAYRFVYLKSEQWQTVRLEALARDGAKCFVCGFYALENDAHHINYPDSIWNTKADDLIILCRQCHDAVHSLLKIFSLKTEDVQIEKLAEVSNVLRDWAGVRRINRGPKTETAKADFLRCYICNQKKHRLEFQFINAELVKTKFGFSRRSDLLKWKVCKNCYSEMLPRVDWPQSPTHQGQVWKLIREYGKVKRKEIAMLTISLSKTKDSEVG